MTFKVVVFATVGRQRSMPTAVCETYVRVDSLPRNVAGTTFRHTRVDHNGPPAGDTRRVLSLGEDPSTLGLTDALRTLSNTDGV